MGVLVRPPLSSPGDQEEKKRKARKRRGYPETPWNHGAGANGFPCCESSKKRNPDASSGAWRFSLDCWPSWRRDADEQRPGTAPAFKKKRPGQKAEAFFFSATVLQRPPNPGSGSGRAPRREAPDKGRGRRRSRGLYIFCLNSLATSTISRKAETVSSQPRVFKPQSGLIHSLSAGITRKAFSTKPAISPRLGTRGLWMS